MPDIDLNRPIRVSGGYSVEILRTNLRHDDSEGAILIGTLATIAIGALAGGYVFLQYWNWFLLPLGAPSIGLAHAIGVKALLHFTTIRVDVMTTEESGLSRLFTYLIYCGVVWGMGAIIHSFM